MKINLKKLGGEALEVAKGSARLAKEKAQEGVEKAKDIDLKEKKEQLQEKAKELLDRDKEDELSDGNAKVLSSEAAILTIFYLMAVDGELHPDEEEKLLEVGKQLDPAFAEHQDAIREVCSTRFDTSLPPEKLYAIIEKSVSSLLDEDRPTRDAIVTPKILVWDMMAIAYSDSDFSEEERNLIRFVADKLDVDQAILLELESSMETLLALEKEEKWIKTTDRSYLEIEEHVNEIADRKSVIFRSIQDLVTL